MVDTVISPPGTTDSSKPEKPPIDSSGGYSVSTDKNESVFNHSNGRTFLYDFLLMNGSFGVYFGNYDWGITVPIGYQLRLIWPNDLPVFSILGFSVLGKVTQAYSYSEPFLEPIKFDGLTAILGFGVQTTDNKNRFLFELQTGFSEWKLIDTVFNDNGIEVRPITREGSQLKESSVSYLSPLQVSLRIERQIFYSSFIFCEFGWQLIDTKSNIEYYEQGTLPNTVGAKIDSNTWPYKISAMWPYFSFGIRLDWWTAVFENN